MNIRDMTENDVMCFGKYEGVMLCDVPPTYLKWLSEQKWISQYEKLDQYLRKNKILINEMVRCNKIK